VKEWEIEKEERERERDRMVFFHFYLIFYINIKPVEHENEQTCISDPQKTVSFPSLSDNIKICPHTQDDNSKAGSHK